MAEKRKFSVHANIIYNLVSAQAGTLSKAVLECIMNSVDAGAKRVDITIDTNSVKISDDGQGFRSKDEIEQFFEVFGFPHEEGERIYGQFGIGRAQLWSFCSTVWRTNQFEMLVDLKHKGLDYDLKTDAKKTRGMHIDGTFYEPLIPSDMASFTREITESAKYVQVPVFLNKKRISKDATKEKWDFDTEDAWVRLTDGGQLSVYNLGVFVKKYPAYVVGSGGIVVTKPGVRLELNMARNEILLSKCPVWKRIKPMLQKKSDERVKRKDTRLSESEAENMALRFLSGELSFEQVKNQKLITDIVGRHHTLYSLINELWKYRSAQAKITVAELGSRLGERAHRERLAFVLSPVTLQRFDVENVAGLFNSILAVLSKDRVENRYTIARIKELKTAESVQEAAPVLSDGHTVLTDKELKPKERAALHALSVIAGNVKAALRRQEDEPFGFQGYRTVHIGVSDSAEAWTDGHSKIVVNRSMLPLLDRGIGGCMGLANLFVHEFLHDSSDIGSHTHDLQFYERYHEATCGAAGELNQAAVKGFETYHKELQKLMKTSKQFVLKHADVIQKASATTTQAA